jgi:integrase
MSMLRLKHVHRVKVGEAIYWYHRLTRERLPAEANARAVRILQINAALAKTTPTSSATPGTFADLCELYLASPEYRHLSATTRADYRKRIDWLRSRFGDLRVATIDREFVIELRDKLADRPRKADWIIQVLRRLLNYALDRGSRFGLTVNPAQRPGRLWRAADDANRPWTDHELETMLASATRPVALMVALAAHTGQREGDALRLTWTAYDGARITVRQSKTKQLVALTVHPRLKAILDALPRHAVTIVTGARGKPLTQSGFQTLFQRERKRLGLTGITFHGLRHMVGVRLAEAGATETEIAAVLGHRTLSMVQHYTRQARQTALADAALARLANKAGEKL